jgi:SAM-dependent methyltransferase
MSVAEATHEQTATMEQAYLEYRRACAYILHRHAEERQLLDQLATPKTADEIIAAMAFLPERKRTLALFLQALARLGSVVAEPGEPLRYVRNPDHAATAFSFDHDLIAQAIGVEKVENLIHGQSYAGIIDTLYVHENPIAADFSSSNTDLWNEFLQMPFYRFSRERAVQALAGAGHRLLDLASGPGFGLSELAEAVGSSGLVIGGEISRGFVAESVERMKAFPYVRVMQLDLEDGLPFFRDAFFDGAMIVGAFHFLKQRQQLFDDVSRVLKPGGRFCVAYTYMRLGSADQELMDLRFHLRQPPSAPPTVEELLGYANRSGLTVADRSTMGCFGTFLFEKRS